MDINDWRSIVTVVSLITFIGVVVWAYGLRSNKKRFDEAAHLPFAEDDVDRAERGLPASNDQGKKS